MFNFLMFYAISFKYRSHLLISWKIMNKCGRYGPNYGSGQLKNAAQITVVDRFFNNLRVCVFAVKYVNPITNVCIIRASREQYQKVWSAITMVTNIGNCPVMFNLLDLSGSIRACKNAALKCEESKFEQYKLMLGDRFSSDHTHRMNTYLDRIKVLEH
ncbi:putative ribonuclease P/MRP protein subunit POP5 isoform B [Glycine soja]|uniref:Putative ribonuclease P/MRP protein subunit POP5 isoform B n=1 Tax=Glycine soja TaxID=3848 RepID=A0A445LS83_GLYSO|nr:putative ribonuclease P/MRP protein subunit POP5 isoform B [Glycine soja]